ncbi:MAG: helix-turn-helix domain-containing protein, partial [Sphingomonas sp.]
RSVQGIFADMATTPTAFITDRRLAVAADMIRGGRDYGTITDLAHQLGFCDAAHFARRFRSRFGMSPGAFVRHCRELH